jgi:toxin ParE1/3/4
VAHRVEFRQAAVDDLTALYERIAAEAGRTRAGAYINRIEAVCMALETFPERGTVRNHLHPGLRVIGFERSASIAFVVHAEVVDILRIMPRGMDFPDEWDSE